MREKLEFKEGGDIVLLGNDRVLRSEYCPYRRRVREGETTLRFLPSIKGSAFDWMMPLDVYGDIGGYTFLSPTTLNRAAEDPIVDAGLKLKKLRPESMYSKVRNPKGLVLRSRKVGMAWAVEQEAPEGERLCLWTGSLYDGVWGGEPGLGYRIRKYADDDDIIDPDSGREVTITKVTGVDFPTYLIKAGMGVAILDEYLALLTDEELEVITPLENTLYEVGEDEIKQHLKSHIGEELYKLCQ
jgi:hypothetical protein